MTEREIEILELIRNNPTISQEELAFELGISRSGVAAHIHNLMKKGYIQGKGYIVKVPEFISVIGGINIDIVGTPNEGLISNNSNPGKINYYVGGAGRNMALALSKLKINTNLMSVYGSDVNGERFVAESRKIGFNIECCERINGYSTSSFMYLEDQENHFRVGVDDMQILENITPEFINRYLQRINQSKYCVIDDNLPIETIQYIENNVNVPIIAKSVSVNKVKRLMCLLPKIELLVLSESELKELTQKDGGEIKPKAMNLISQGVGQVIVIKGNGNVLYFSKEDSYEIKGDVVPAYNRNGSTAVLTSAMIWAKLQNRYTRKEIVQLGYCGSVTSFLTNNSVFDGLNENLVLANYNQYFKN
ncbi:PfkB family carbohydrate kinase [Vagococcus hydrophili]|uniref:Winged helix-turn-helix transcriptional regulator n=1 Tax=Vagococcus hydrophili TaxID=2714947 RepID=A0A6G8ARV5_9ENTE|nr:PfkB family carbohydrate kinase [Vagococcus hydrophili]QIL47672.1 winged helix-turn-helix transcriptional regulator [Vagococcus hydrophili]